MNAESNLTNMIDQRLKLENWLLEVSLLDGKCCYVSKKSELRARLILIIDINEKYGKEIIRIFDENLWINDGNIYELNSSSLNKIQNKISEASYINNVVEGKKFNLKNEFTAIVLNQSTMLAILIACVIFSRFILHIFSSVLFLDAFITTTYVLTLLFVIYITDIKLKNIVITSSVVTVLIFIAMVLWVYSNSGGIKFIGFSDLLGLTLLLMFNISLVGSSLFSLFYTFNNLIENQKKVPWFVFVIIATIIYGVLITVFMQGLKTVEF